MIGCQESLRGGGGGKKGTNRRIGHFENREDNLYSTVADIIMLHA